MGGSAEKVVAEGLGTHAPAWRPRRWAELAQAVYQPGRKGLLPLPQVPELCDAVPMYGSWPAARAAQRGFSLIVLNTVTGQIRGA